MNQQEADPVKGFSDFSLLCWNSWCERPNPDSVLPMKGVNLSDATPAIYSIKWLIVWIMGSVTSSLKLLDINPYRQILCTLLVLCKKGEENEKNSLKKTRGLEM